MKKEKIIILTFSLLLIGLQPLSKIAFASDNNYIVPNKVTDYRINDMVTYDGDMRNGKLDGVGTLTYKNNYTLVGEFKGGQLDENKKVYLRINENLDIFNGYLTLDEDYKYNFIEGEYTNRKQGFVYNGKFKNNLYNDEKGKLTFKDNTCYEGKFVDGSNLEQVGTIYYSSYAKNEIGVHYFTGKMKTINTFYPNQNGKGEIKYGDYSTYNGDLHFDGSNFYRKGYGEMDFSTCSFYGRNAGTMDDVRVYKYIGEFDHYKTGWMSGNGIMYFVDIKTLQPKAYIKGYFNGVTVIGDYQKSEVSLIEGYDESMEREFIFNYPYMKNYINNYYYQGSPSKNVICGDSYVDMMHKQYNIIDYEKEFPISYEAINTGIGGTTYYHWRYLAKELIFPYQPEKVVLHLGFNDLHMGLTPEQVINDAKYLVDEIRNAIPNVNIYLMSVEPSPCFASFLQIEIEYNNLLKDYCRNNNVGLIDHAQILMKSTDATIDDLSNYFISDRVHLNSNGYKSFVSMIKDIL